MNNDALKISNLYDLNETIAAKVFEDCTFPWEVLAKIGNFIVELGNTLPEDEYEKRGENIWVHRTANVFPSAYIAGPAIIGKDAETLCIYPWKSYCWRGRGCGKFHRIKECYSFQQSTGTSLQLCWGFNIGLQSTHGSRFYNI